MTPERAAKILETGCKMPAIHHTCDELDESCKMAAAALRAQQTTLDRIRWGGCDICTAGDGEFRYLLRKWGEDDYCPRCGRPLTEEAWAELERRINGGTAE